ncbi:hypothetical protein TNCV_3582131 [Trichonephila clavipes]|nr:hypothetical protein TNCV_3582131 [Trichonephila clavipes]
MPAIEIITTINTSSKATTMTSRIPTITKSSTSTQAQLLPSTSSVPVTPSSESQPPIPLIDTAPATSNSICTCVASSSSNKKLFSTTGPMFSPSPAETSPVLKTSTTSDTIPSTSQVSKMTKTLKKKCPHKAITPRLNNSFKPRKSKPLPDTLDQDMLEYDVEEETEVQKGTRRWLTLTKYRK